MNLINELYFELFRVEHNLAWATRHFKTHLRFEVAWRLVVFEGHPSCVCTLC